MAVCERCDWAYLLPAGSLPQRCPHCFQADLTAWHGDVNELPHANPPELALPFTVTAVRLSSAVQQFTSGIPFPPEDLNPKNLQARLRRCLPADVAGGCRCSRHLAGRSGLQLRSGQPPGSLRREPRRLEPSAR